MRCGGGDLKATIETVTGATLTRNVERARLLSYHTNKSSQILNTTSTSTSQNTSHKRGQKKDLNDPDQNLKILDLAEQSASNTTVSPSIHFSLT